MSYPLTGQPAAERIEAFLRQHDARIAAGSNTGNLIADYAQTSLSAVDLWSVLAELHEYQQAVAAVLEIPSAPSLGRDEYNAGFNSGLGASRQALAKRITGLHNVI